MKAITSTLKWIIRPSPDLSDIEDIRKASLLSALLFLFATAMNFLSAYSLIFGLANAEGNTIILYTATVCYNLLYFFSRSRHFQIVGFAWLTILTLACYTAIGNAATNIAVMNILLYCSIIILASGLILPTNLTLILSAMVIGGVGTIPQTTNLFTYGDMVSVLIFFTFVTFLMLSWKYIQREHIEKIKEDAITIEDQHAEIVQTSNLAAIGEIAGGIAHEINNPLAVIQGNAKLVEKHIAKQELDEAVKSAEIIGATCLRIKGITRGMLEMCRSVSEREVFNLLDALNDAIVLSSFSLKGAGVKILSSHTPPIDLVGVKTQVVQVFANIFKNAIDAFGPEQHQRWIKVSWHLEQNGIIKISIANNGEEIPDVIRSKIMDPFFTTKGVHKGTGLGLSITSKILDAHGGTIKVKSAQNETTFDIEIPSICSSPSEAREGKDKTE